MPDQELETVCQGCQQSLGGQKFVRRDEQPFCVGCYEARFANTCASCSQRIQVDQKDLKHRDMHWHEACFVCSGCRQSLVEQSFVSYEAIVASQAEQNADKLAQLKLAGHDVLCPACYDQHFAVRCDRCAQVFQAGSKKFEYKQRRFHEDCFKCCECQRNIGADKFVPRDDQGATVCCLACYEEKFTKKCAQCQKAIKEAGVVYREQPWHKECFVCSKCKKQLAGQQFVTQDDKPFCLDCYGLVYAKKCSSCTKPIIGLNGYKFISFEDHYYHSECFNCTKCRSNLVGKGFLLTDGNVFCPDCTA